MGRDGREGRLEGKVALITGGASGLGAASARHMIREGARVVLADLQEERGQKLASELGDAALFVRHDVTREDDWQQLLAAARERFGALHVVLNSAGVSIPAPIDEATFEHWRQIMSVNADGTFLGCKYGVEALRESGGGSIVNISSTMGIRGGPIFAAYCASKGAVRLLTKSVALRCAEQGWNIRCNSIHPGAIETPMMDPYLAQSPTREEGLASFGAVHPLGRVGQPHEIANTVVFLASDESSYITGAEIPVDGGFCA
ncbi:MAG: glucose 1-dehydrogenase [Proteobacteria bacterium]|nr:glucose 1-dehydrogenase [Pseudomonadota bacterium]